MKLEKDLKPGDRIFVCRLPANEQIPITKAVLEKSLEEFLVIKGSNTVPGKKLYLLKLTLEQFIVWDQDYSYPRLGLGTVGNGEFPCWTTIEEALDVAFDEAQDKLTVQEARIGELRDSIQQLLSRT